MGTDAGLAIAQSSNSRLPLIAGLATIYIVWGTTYLGIRVAVESIPPLLMTGSRYVIAGVILLVWVRLRGGPDASWPRRRQWVSACVSGGLMILVGTGVLSWEEQLVPSGLAAVLYVAPLWLAVFARILLGESIVPLTVVGLALGLIGVIVLVDPFTVSAPRFIPAAAVVVGSAGWASGSVLSKRLDLPRNPFQVAGMLMLAGGVLTVLASVVTGDASRLRIADLTTRAELAYVYLLLVGAVLGFGIFAWLIKSAPIGLVATYGYVNPIVAVIIGAVVMGETLGARELAGGAIVIVGIALMVTAQSWKRAAAQGGVVVDG